MRGLWMFVSNKNMISIKGTGNTDDPSLISAHHWHAIRSHAAPHCYSVDRYMLRMFKMMNSVLKWSHRNTCMSLWGFCPSLSILSLEANNNSWICMWWSLVQCFLSMVEWSITVSSCSMSPRGERRDVGGVGVWKSSAVRVHPELCRLLLQSGCQSLPWDTQVFITWF